MPKRARRRQRPLTAKGAEAVFVRTDVSREADVAAAVATVLERWGTIDILVNNAAIPGVNKFAHEVAVEEWDLVFAVNVRGPFLCTKHVVPDHDEGRARVHRQLLVDLRLIGNDDLPPYHAAKGAVLMMTKTDAVCYAPTASG